MVWEWLEAVRWPRRRSGTGCHYRGGLGRLGNRPHCEDAVGPGKRPVPVDCQKFLGAPIYSTTASLREAEQVQGVGGHPAGLLS